MIKLGERSPTPKTLLSNEVLELKECLRSKVERGEKLRSEDFPSHWWRKDDVVKVLWEMHRGKCCYCERRRDMKRERDVEHFRPKSGIAEDRDHRGYWWLAYDWENYFSSCKKCNQYHKKNHFPLMNGSSRACTPEDNLTEEKPFFVNPEKENPEHFIGFKWIRTKATKVWGLVKAVGLDDEKRGYTTIELIGLNDGTIPEERAELLDVLQDIADTMLAALKNGSDREVNKTAEKIKRQTLSKLQFAGFRRFFFKSYDLSEYVSNV